MELTVACLWWNQWCKELGPVYVVRLKNMLERHLSVPHRFVCFTDRPDLLRTYGVETLPMDCPRWRWNFRKMILYKNDNGLKGRVLAFDLDNIILDSIDWILEYRGPFCVLEDFYAKGSPGGNIMSFEAGTLHDVFYEPLMQDGFRLGWKFRGSERLWYREAPIVLEFWQHLFPSRIVNYKPRPDTRLTKVPQGASIVCFHGRPRPHEVDDPWVLQNWK